MTQLEAGLTSSDGQWNTQEVQPLKLLFEDRTGKLFGHFWGNRFFVHTLLPFPKTQTKHYILVMSALEDKLRQHGLDKYYTFVTNQTQFDYTSQMFGFNTTYETFDNINEIMVKCL